MPGLIDRHSDGSTSDQFMTGVIVDDEWQSDQVPGDAYRGKSDQGSMSRLNGSHVDGRTGDEMVKVVKADRGKSGKVSMPVLNDKHVMTSSLVVMMI